MIQNIRKILVVFAIAASLFTSFYMLIHKQMMLSFCFLSSAVLLGLLSKER